MAPPQIPVIKMPAKEPWFLVTELRPSEIIIGYITAIKKPTAGKAYKVMLAPPNKAIDKEKIDEVIEEMSTNEFKEMVLDDYFDFTKDNLDDVDVELNEIISEISNTIRLGDYRI